MTTVMAASQRRTILANAHAAWHATRMTPAFDAVHNLKQSLVQANYMASHDIIADVHLDGTTICIRIDADDFFENVEIDAYGNILRGAD